MSKSRPQQALAVLAALALVATAVGTGLGGAAPAAAPVGTVSAQAADDPECSTFDAIIYDALAFGSFNLQNESTNPCSAEYQRQQLADEWNETNAEDTRTQIHSQAGQLAAGNGQFLTAIQNGLTNSETIAFSKGEAAAVETLANGGTVAEAQAAANESIEDYYTVKQLNALDRWEVAAETAITLKQRSQNTTGVDPDFVTAGEESDFGDSFDVGSIDSINYASVNWTNSKTVTLINGTSTSTVAMELEVSRQDESISQTATESVTIDPIDAMTVSGSGSTNGTWGYNPDGTAATIYLTSVRVRPTSNLTSKSPVVVDRFAENIQEIDQQSTQTKEEVAAYVNASLAPAVENGELNATSYVSSATLAQEYAQEYNGSEGYVRALSIAASSGMSTPDLENTASMTVSHDGTTYSGMLLSQNGPENDTWESGATYDPALISGLQFFAVEGSNGTVIELDGPFTIESISGMDGGEIETAETQQVKYVVSNESANYSALQQQIRTLEAELELQRERATAPPAGGGGGGGGGPSLPDWIPGGWAGLLSGLGVGVGVLTLGGLVIGAVLLGIVARVAL